MSARARQARLSGDYPIGQTPDSTVSTPSMAAIPVFAWATVNPDHQTKSLIVAGP